MIRFLAYNKFPEVYHAHGISKAAFYGVEHARGRGKSQTQYMGCHLAGKAKTTTRYGLRGPLRAGVRKEDPVLPFFGSQRKKREGVCTDRTVCIERIVLYYLYCTVSNVLCIFHSQDTLPV
ncbi:hypothetical protein FD476_20865 [Salmonella enterica]|nr:hypothetical protein [Salmonella enterica]ECC9580836.1 hypothetical protein [Salmonella enterica subsp. houtenae]EEE2294717.1 hypothetical protein [Salmonella enterica subsp. houtenae]